MYSSFVKLKKSNSSLFTLFSNVFCSIEKRFLINDREPFNKGRERPSMSPLKDKAIAINVGRNEGLTNSDWVFTHT